MAGTAPGNTLHPHSRSAVFVLAARLLPLSRLLDPRQALVEPLPHFVGIAGDLAHDRRQRQSCPFGAAQGPPRQSYHPFGDLHAALEPRY